MADFVAVLRKTLDGLTETTPQTREKVYEKARLTIAGKLAAMNPPPSQAVVDRQKRALEEAIAEIERSFAPAKPAAVDPLVELENVFASLKSPDPLAVFRQAPKPAEPRPEPIAPQPKSTTGLLATTAAIRPVEPQQQAGDVAEADPVADPFAFEQDNPASEAIATERPARKAPGPGLFKALAAVVVVALLAGGGYGVWLNRGAFADMLGLGSTSTAKAPEKTQPGTQVASAPAADANKPAAQPEEPKFTQRLNPDGTEVDAGPAAGEAGIGEGTSVAAVTQPPAPSAATPQAEATPSAQPPAEATPPAAAETPPAETPPAQPPAETATAAPPAPEQPAAPADQAATAAPAPQADNPPTEPIVRDQVLPVGQRAIFYEERTNVADASAEPGSIVWSLVQESPGGNLPPEPAIRAEATIPGKDVQLRMTIRRNADQTLPASHIIELIFLTPQNFDGGGVDNVLRISMKGSEQEAGSPLLGIPAKIADGFFLIALNDTKAEIDANMTLLRNQSWIDVPVQYKSGRRALFTMEKGIPGTKVFDEAIKAWQSASSG